MQSGPPTITTSGFFGLALRASRTINSVPADLTGDVSSILLLPGRSKSLSAPIVTWGTFLSPERLAIARSDSKSARPSLTLNCRPWSHWSFERTTPFSIARPR